MNTTFLKHFYQNYKIHKHFSKNIFRQSRKYHLPHAELVKLMNEAQYSTHKPKQVEKIFLMKLQTSLELILLNLLGSSSLSEDHSAAYTVLVLFCDQ